MRACGEGRSGGATQACGARDRQVRRGAVPERIHRASRSKQPTFPQRRPRAAGMRRGDGPAAVDRRLDGLGIGVGRGCLRAVSSSCLGS